MFWIIFWRSFGLQLAGSNAGGMIQVYARKESLKAWQTRSRAKGGVREEDTLRVMHAMKRTHLLVASQLYCP